jgi:tRNA threonylcarbamoyladenosine biosynthesis protein TsaB
MAYILHIETSTKNCSVSVAYKGKCIALIEEEDMHFSHAEKLQSFINKAVQEADITLKELDAVAVSEGPGSYTGLRIGVATAKGLCYALDLPLISISTLANLARQIQGYERIIPLLEARKMEVYTAVFDDKFQMIKKPHTEVLKTDSFIDYVANYSVAFVGNAVDKWNDLTNERYFTKKTIPSSREMILPAFKAYQNKDFVDMAYFEPFYLKDFIAGPTKAK